MSTVCAQYYKLLFNIQYVLHKALKFAYLFCHLTGLECDNLFVPCRQLPLPCLSQHFIQGFLINSIVLAALKEWQVTKDDCNDSSGS